MIDFKEELDKYEPVLSVDEVEPLVKDEIKDIMELLQYITGKLSKE